MMHARHQSIRPKTELLVQTWRQITLKELSKDKNNGEPPQVTEDLVRELLLKYGEVERAQNTALIREMVMAASSTSGLLDDEAWINALSSGIDEWQPGAEERTITTFFEDVFRTRNPHDVYVEDLVKQDCKEVERIDENDVARSYQENVVSIKGDTGNQDEMVSTGVEDENSRRCTGSACCHKRRNQMFPSETFNIDMVTDAHASLWIVVLIWVFYILTYDNALICHSIVLVWFY